MNHNQPAHSRESDAQNAHQANGVSSYSAHPHQQYPPYSASSRPQSASTNIAMPAAYPQSPRQPPPASPTKPIYTPSGPRTTYFDPTSESRPEYRASSRDSNPPYPATSPYAQHSQHQAISRGPALEHPPPPAATWYNGSSGTTHASESSIRATSHHSPSGSASDHHVRPYSPSRLSHTSPPQAYAQTTYSQTNGGAERTHMSPPRPTEPTAAGRNSEEPRRGGAANPMSFSEMLSGPGPSADATVSANPPVATVKTEPQQQPVPSVLAEQAKTPTTTFENSVAPAPRVASPSAQPKEVNMDDARTYTPKQVKQIDSVKKVKLPKVATFKSKPAPAGGDAGLSEKVRKAMSDIENQDHSDYDGPEWESAKSDHLAQSKKRQLKIRHDESGRIKRRRSVNGSKIIKPLDILVKDGNRKYRVTHVAGVESEVAAQDVADEKERKKDMQRKRRREKALQTETQKANELSKQADMAETPEARAKYLKDAAKAAKKARDTERKMNGLGKEHADDLSIDAPSAPNFEGGTEGSFHIDVNGAASPEPPKKRLKGPGGRLKKSKEQKEAEKRSAAEAYEAEQRGEPVPIASKDELRDTPVKEAKEGGAKRGRKKKVLEEDLDQHDLEGTPSAAAKDPFSSKAFLQIYDTIWRDIARKDVPKVYRLKGNSLETKQSNLRKTAQLASKEARRWQQRTNKSTKDVQARAKRNMREMMGFWKRNERNERDSRKNAERLQVEALRKAEAEHEANRQKRKLNFLISQTELYSHFIGKKIKTDEVERSTDSADVANGTEKVADDADGAKKFDLSKANPTAKVTNFDELDFNSDDEDRLQEAAAANAQAAIQEAQDKARAFDAHGKEEGEGDSQMKQFDEGEMNFQNPTSLGDIVLKQPESLTVQLKEYQLKGLNWLANLYEQGINGILADEMGLGKTIQSISVMAYLAETHNIWGPFLVIAPASTLHNWQQEITRFVPNIKVLPYWGTAKDRKVLRKYWDRKHITYTKDSPFHVLVTSYQLVVMDTQYFQKIRWQYMILDEAQAIKSAQSSRWKALLSFKCRNRLLLTGTPIQNNMQELWALLHFIMPSLFDNHDEFSEWFSKDIESHAQSNTKLNEDQLKRLHMILKPFMLRRVKKHVQKELGDKIEEDIFCDLTYRQRAIYSSLRSKISIMDLIEKASVGDDQDTATLMNLVMQFRKVCNHPDLFERAETTSPLALCTYAEAASFLREGHFIDVGYSTKNVISYELPRMLCSPDGQLNRAGPANSKAGFRRKYLGSLFNIWSADHVASSSKEDNAFAWLRFVNASASEVSRAGRSDLFGRAIEEQSRAKTLGRMNAIYEDESDSKFTPRHSIFNIVDRNDRRPLAEVSSDGYMKDLLNVSQASFDDSGMSMIEQCARPRASAPPITVACSNLDADFAKEDAIFNKPVRKALFTPSLQDEAMLLESNISPTYYPASSLLPEPVSRKSRFTNIQVPNMRRFVTDSAKLGKLDKLLRKLKAEGHRVLLYFQMTRMIDLMEEYLTYRNYKYCRLDGSTKLEDRRDTVADFQTRPEIFIFLLSTRAGGLGINLTSADTVIFYDSDWNPTIDSQAMDRAHRLGQTKQVTVYRMITRGTIEERIRKRSLQKEEMQRVVMTGGAGAAVNFDSRARENKTKDIAMWLADDDQAEMIEKKERELAEKGGDENIKRKKKDGRRKKEVNVEDFYHEGEGHFDDQSGKPSGAATPMEDEAEAPKLKRGPRGGKGLSKKAKTAKQRLAIADGAGDI